MPVTRYFTEDERTNSIRVFVRSLETGVPQIEAARQAGQVCGASRQSIQQWARAAGYELAPTFAQYRALERVLAEKNLRIYELEKEIERLRTDQEEARP